MDPSGLSAIYLIGNLIFTEKSSGTRTQIDFCNDAFTDFDSI